MSKRNDLSKSLVALNQDATLIAVVEMGQASWLVAGIVPGLDRLSLEEDRPGPRRPPAASAPLARRSRESRQCDQQEW
jgi:hypothetical protein